MVRSKSKESIFINIRPRPGGYPGVNMRFKIDENLKRVAAEKNAAPEFVSLDLLAGMMNAGLIDYPEDEWMKTVAEATGQRYVSDVCGMLAEYLYGDESRSIPADVFDAFCALIVIGNGPCPDCGGDLVFVEEVGHEIKDGDYWTPNSYVHEYDVYKCGECGKIIKIK